MRFKCSLDNSGIWSWMFWTLRAQNQDGLDLHKSCLLCWQIDDSLIMILNIIIVTVSYRKNATFYDCSSLGLWSLRVAHAFIIIWLGKPIISTFILPITRILLVGHSCGSKCILLCNFACPRLHPIVPVKPAFLSCPSDTLVVNAVCNLFVCVFFSCAISFSMPRCSRAASSFESSLLLTTGWTIATRLLVSSADCLTSFAPWSRLCLIFRRSSRRFVRIAEPSLWLTTASIWWSQCPCDGRSCCSASWHSSASAGRWEKEVCLAHFYMELCQLARPVTFSDLVPRASLVAMDTWIGRDRKRYLSNKTSC